MNDNARLTSVVFRLNRDRLEMLKDLSKETRIRQSEYLREAISDLLEKYEEKHYPIPDPSDAQLLAALIEQRGVTQAEVSRGTGIAVPTICQIVAGKRKIARTHMGRLARFFHVSPAAFVPEGEAPQD